MAFPLNIEFNEKLQLDNNETPENRLLEVIESYLKENQISEWMKADNKIKFKSHQYTNSYSNSAFSGIDRGEFSIEKVGDDYNLKYKFYYVQIVIIIFVLLVVFAIITSEVGAAIMVFLFLVFGGVTLSIYRQNITFYKIVDLLNPKFVRPK